MRKYLHLMLIFLLFAPSANAQIDELETVMDSLLAEHIDFTLATFKSTRIINGQSIERMQRNHLDFRIAHRFGEINSGFFEFFGLDNANTQLGLEYGLADYLMIGVSRSTYKKMFTSFAKCSIFRQQTGKTNIPVSVSYVASAEINSLEITNNERSNYFSSRISYSHQLLIARKFTSSLSLQLTPIFVHRNLVKYNIEPNDLYALGFSGRCKFTKRSAFTFEYFQVFTAHNTGNIKYYNPLSFGIDIETGGHVFQLFLTNSRAINESGFVGESTENWLKGDIHLGFNISRVFRIN